MSKNYCLCGKGFRKSYYYKNHGLSCTKIKELTNVNFDENSKNIIVKKIDYKINNKYIKKCDIKFKKLNDIPYGIIDCCSFNIDNYIYIFSGHSAGYDSIIGLSYYSNKLIGKFEKKFYNNLLRYNIEKDEWNDLGEIDISPRTSAGFFTYKKQMYVFGGYIFDFMTKKDLDEYEKKYGKWPEKQHFKIFDDMYKITIINDQINITKINIKLPKIYKLNVIIIKNKLYFIGGLTGEKQHSKIDLSKLDIKNNHLKKNIYMTGSILFSIDLENINKGLQIESLFPGIPTCFDMVNKNDYIYFFSKYVCTDNHLSSFRPGEKNKISCSDNWKYNLNNKKWTRLSNFPLTGFTSSITKFNDDYAVLLGGFRCFLNTSIDKIKINTENKIIGIDIPIPIEKINFKMSKDGNYNAEKSDIKPFFKYGSISNTFSLYNQFSKQYNVTKLENIGAYDYFQHYLSDLIMFYNFDEDKFYFSDHHLPYNINLSTVKIINNNIFLLGEEINDILFNNKFHGIQSNICIKLTIENLK